MAIIDFDEIVEIFEFLDDWEERYRYVIELGKKMPPLEEALKVYPGVKGLAENSDIQATL